MIPILKSRPVPLGIILLTLIVAFSFGAIVRVAWGAAYHTTCVGHGFEAGGSQTDGSFFSRVQTGCSSTYRHCAIYSGGSYVGEQNTPDTTTTCSAWSYSFSTSLTECASTAHVSNPGVFSEHVHLPDNWCG